MCLIFFFVVQINVAVVVVASWSDESHHPSERQLSLFSAIACALDIGSLNDQCNHFVLHG